MIDRLLAIIIILLSIPFLILIIIAQFVAFGKIFFFQNRIGKEGRPFQLIKFISMSSSKEDKTGVKSKWGRFTRKYSLDEIPQLFNIIIGDMKFIGPRPLLPEYLPFYTAEQNIRHKVKPGLTGWAQVNGRGNNTWQRQFELDVWFVKNNNLKICSIIVCKTLQKILSPQKGEDLIRERFNGKN